MPSTTICVAGEFHSLKDVIGGISTQFTGHTGKIDPVTESQFNIILGLGLVNHRGVLGSIGVQNDVIGSDPCTGNAQFNNKSVLFLVGHKTSVEAGTSAPVTFVYGTVAGFTHIEAIVLHGSGQASAEHTLSEKSAHPKSKGEVLKVVVVVLDIKHTEARRPGNTKSKATCCGSLVGFGLLGSFSGGNRIGLGLLAGFFGSGDRISYSLLASLFGGDGVRNCLLTGSFFGGSDRIGYRLLASLFGGASVSVNRLTQGIDSAGICGRGFGYRCSRSRFSSRGCGYRLCGRGRLCSGGWCRSSGRSRCGRRSRCGSGCSRSLSISPAHHRGKENNHCKFLHRFSIHKRVCIKITGKYIKNNPFVQVFSKKRPKMGIFLFPERFLDVKCGV